MKHHKLLLTSLAVVLILSLTAIGCSAFASTGYELVDMLVPTAIRFESPSVSTLVSMPNDYFIDGSQEITVYSPENAYVDISSEPNLTTLFYGSYAYTVYISYSSFYDIPMGDFVARRNVTFDFYNGGFDPAIISQNVVMSVVYVYYDTNGLLREEEYLSTISPTDSNTFTVDFRTLVENYGSGNGYIKSVDLIVIFDDDNPCDSLEFTSRESGEYGIVNGERLPTAIAGTIDDFDVIGWLVDSVNTFLAMPVFGSGLTVGGLLAIFVAFPVVIWFLKLMAGG